MTILSRAIIDTEWHWNNPITKTKLATRKYETALKFAWTN